MAWASLADNQWVSRADLQDAVDTGVFTLNPGQSIPASPAALYVRCDEVPVWLNAAIDPNIPTPWPYPVTNNEWPQKSWIVALSEFLWVEDTYTCEQDDPFATGTTYNGFSSPMAPFWDETQQRFYVVDQDDINGNLFWFDPTTFTGFGDQTYVPGSIAPGTWNLIHSCAHSPSLRKIFMAGPDTSGVMVYNIATNSFTNVNDGTTNGSFARLFARIMNGMLYVTNRLSNTITIINPSTEAVVNTIDVTTIPGNTSNQFFNNSYNIHSVNGELWVCAAAYRLTSGHIARYNADFTTLLGTITIPGVSIVPSGSWFNGFWQSQFFDEDKNKFYLSDTGSKTVTVIDTTTNTVDEQIPITNLEGRLYPIVNWVLNELTGQLYTNKQTMNNPNAVGASNKFYILDRDIYQYTAMFPNSLANGLTLQPGTNQLWAINVGTQRDTAGWDTDGQIFKYIS